jgi:hypothetical protein
MRGTCDNEEGELNQEQPFPRVLGYKRSDIKEGDIIRGKSVLYSINGEIRLLVLDKLVEFDKQSVEVQDFKKTTHRFRGNLRNEPRISKEILEHQNI